MDLPYKIASFLSLLKERAEFQRFSCKISRGTKFKQFAPGSLYFVCSELEFGVLGM